MLALLSSPAKVIDSFLTALNDADPKIVTLFADDATVFFPMNDRPLRATGRGDKTKFWAPPSAERLSLFGVFKALLRRDVFVLLILVAVALGLQQAAVALFPLAALGALVASSVRLMQSKGTA